MIAIFRVIKVRVFKKVYQGASTIEQQFVRVVSKIDMKKSFYRKFREQLFGNCYKQKKN